MKGNYLVAICDILGFSKLIINNDVDTVLKFGLGFLTKTLQHSLHKDEFPNDKVSYKTFRKHEELAVTWFSDTILIYTKKDENESCKKLLETVGWLMFENMFQPNTRLRVGISYGEAYMDEDEEIYIGKPIVEAYQLEKKQEWSCGALTKNAEERFGDYLANLNPVQSWVVPYSIPMKYRLKEKLLAINWTVGFHDRSFRQFNWRKNKPEPDEQDYINQPDIIEKWKNTKQFHTETCWQCFPALNNGIISPPMKFWK